MSDDPFAKYAQPTSADPFAKYTQARQAPQQTEPTTFLGKTFEGAINPVVNMATYPVRDLAARIVGAIPPIGNQQRGGALPVDEASRAKFYQEYNRAMGKMTLPESRTGQTVSNILSIPGQVIGAGAQALGRATIGPQATTAISPYVGALADVAPLAAGRLAQARAAAPRPAAMTPRPEAMAARNAGYVLPPGEIMERPGLVAQALAAGGGKVKTEQAFSQRNQAVTNGLARQTIGLSGNTPLRPNDFTAARQPAEQAYNDLQQATPEVALAADPAHRQAVEKVGIPQGEVEQFFPEMANNPRIVELRQTLLQSAKAPTTVVRQKIGDLRRDAQINFRKREDAQAHQLGLAQVQAAEVLEEAVERSIGYGRNGVRALDLVHQAEAKLAHAQDVVTGRSRTPAPGGIPAATQGVARAKAALQQTMALVTPEQRIRAGELLDRYRDARRRFAQVFTVQSATNMATGNVKASRIANMRSTYKKRLTGGLEQIANTHDAFPHMVREPTFGREDYSIFDAYGAGAAITHGHPLAAAAIGLRAPIRRALTGPRMQNRMFARPRIGERPGRATAAGIAAVPEQDQDKQLYTTVTGH